MRCGTVALTMLMGLMTLFASAHHVPQISVRGTVLALDQHLLTVTVHDGSTVQVRLLDDYSVFAVTAAKRASITSGTYIGTAARRQPDGTLTALEILIFPESVRGIGAGHYPWERAPESTVTNAIVAKVVELQGGLRLTLTSEQHDVQVVVPPQAPVVTYRRGTKSLLQPGIRVFLTAIQQPNGMLTTARVFVDKDSLVPPM